ncbi:MAG: hypothetical protein GWN97_22520 [Thermoplasmata archaeon]|nr:hypothetical protein [Thermoplasmata archaeon]
MIPELDLVADFMPNPLKSGPRFVVAKRYSFDALQSQYQHTLGLMAQMAKLNVLAVIAAEDATFRETNIIGDLDQAEYQRGRFATNYFTPGTQIERPTGDVAFQVFQQLDRLERHFRITANYSVQEDGQSPLDFATGRGIENLNAAQDSNGAEYQTVLRHAIERLDSKRLEWAEELYGDRKLTISIHSNGETRTESYRPTRDIAGEYDSRRVYGVMAGWDEPSKIVTGLQLLQGEIIDHETFQENVHGLDNIPKVNERIKKKKAEDRLFDILSQTAIDPANPQAPQARAAMREIAKTGDVDRVMEKFFAPDGEEPDPALQAQLAAEQQQGALAGLGGPGGAPPDVATVLSRLTQSGGAEGGVQTVGQL